jgi:hypothetical protein
MQHPDPATAREWLSAALDGELGHSELAALAASIAHDPELAREQRDLRSLANLLAGSRFPVAPGFHRQVTSRLPAAGWEARHPRSWRFALALLLFLGGASAALLGTGSARLAPASPLLAALGAVADLFSTAALTGAGMLAASWKGLGLALSELLAGSALGVGALGVLVLSLNGLFFVLWRGTVRAVAIGAREQRLPRRR